MDNKLKKKLMYKAQSEGLAGMMRNAKLVKIMGVITDNYG